MNCRVLIPRGVVTNKKIAAADIMAQVMVYWAFLYQLLIKKSYKDIPIGNLMVASSYLLISSQMTLPVSTCHKTSQQVSFMDLLI